MHESEVGCIHACAHATKSGHLGRILDSGGAEQKARAQAQFFAAKADLVSLFHRHIKVCTVPEYSLNSHHYTNASQSSLRTGQVLGYLS